MSVDIDDADKGSERELPDGSARENGGRDPSDSDSLTGVSESELADFHDPSREWRRLSAEAFGAFFLVLTAAGGEMMRRAFEGQVSRSAAVVAPGVMVMAMIMFMGRVSGAHYNPAVTVAFAMRRDFPWRRVPGYIVVQLVGAVVAVLFLQVAIHVPASYGGTYPATTGPVPPFLMELVLTLGLISVILGTASGAQNVGIIGAIGVGGYIALAGLWGSPISGASMNPARTLGPDIVSGRFSDTWLYMLAEFGGALLAVSMAQVLRGSGGGRESSHTAQGEIDPEVKDPSQE